MLKLFCRHGMCFLLGECRGPFLPPPNLSHFLPKAGGVSEYYEIMYKYWEAPLKALEEQRREKAKLKGIKEVEVIPDDDDGDLEALEVISLQQAQRGIVVEGVIVIDDGAGGERLAGNPKSNTDDMKSGASGESMVEKPEPLGEVEVYQTPPSARTRSPPTPLNIDHVLNPPGLPNLGPYDLPGHPNALRAPSQTAAYEAWIQALQ